MPKKTRKEKLQSLERRRRYSDAPQSTTDSQVQHQETESEKKEDAFIRKYFIQDFRKSLILVVLIIIIEIGFYTAAKAGVLAKYLPL